MTHANSYSKNFAFINPFNAKKVQRLDPGMYTMFILEIGILQPGEEKQDANFDIWGILILYYLFYGT